jgi:hypothetical protein
MTQVPPPLVFSLADFFSLPFFTPSSFLLPLYPSSSPSPTHSLLGESIGCAIAASKTLSPGESLVVAFSVSWDCPLARFSSGSAYYRRYTRFYGREVNQKKKRSRREEEDEKK